ncbi:MAG: tetratricopeptide repeat protein [Marinilabiliales bacterium]|nr:tetratricopeptide repeat protein [Marinilabiliales bacterium]
MKNKIFIWIILAAGSFSGVHASNILVEKANKAYTDGLYAEAADLYKKVAVSGYQAPGLYYNLGNSCFKLNDFPGAILWYERAKRLDPGNEDIAFNLNVANSKIADKIEPVPEMFYRRWYFSLVNRFTADGWAWIAVICFLAAFSAASLYLISARLFLRKAGFWSGAVFLVLFLFALLLPFRPLTRPNNVKEAIVFTPSVTVKSSRTTRALTFSSCMKGPRSGSWTRSGPGMRYGSPTVRWGGFPPPQWNGSDPSIGR